MTSGRSTKGDASAPVTPLPQPTWKVLSDLTIATPVDSDERSRRQAVALASRGHAVAAGSRGQTVAAGSRGHTVAAGSRGQTVAAGARRQFVMSSGSRR